MDPMRRMRILKQHVQTDRLLGVGSVPLGAARALGPGDGSGDQRAGVPGNTPGDIPVEGHSVSSDQARPRPAVTLAVMGREEKIQALRTLDEQEVRNCKRCVLCQGRIQTVFGEGDPDAPIMFVGEGPGQNEDEQGRPFVGRSGDLLEKQIQAIGFERSRVYIANVVKCRPPNNRTPQADEVDACWDYLRRQIQIIRPRVIITLGGPAAKLVLGVKEGITRIRGTWHEYPGVDPAVPVMPTFHPAYLLRQYTKENRAKVWSDLKAARAKLQDKLY
jgi:uracil-DNA glycosylase